LRLQNAASRKEKGTLHYDPRANPARQGHCCPDTGHAWITQWPDAISSSRRIFERRTYAVRLRG
jgi:hypothetical protein